MKIGAIGFATCQGLGVLLKDFYDNGIIDKVLTVKHRCYENYEGWYGDSYTKKQLDEFLDEIDVLLILETPFTHDALYRAREKNVKTVLVPMYECTPANLPIELIDKVINPSELDKRYYPQGEVLPIPVPRWIKWRGRTTARVFVHNAGHGGVQGRNGTKELIKAIPMIKSNARIIIRTQNEKLLPSDYNKLRNTEIRLGTCSKEELYDEGDVFLFPEKFNGLSLPLQEAKASGMLIMGTDRFPINTWTQRDCLIPSYTSRDINPFGIRIKEDMISPEAIAQTVDDWYRRNISGHSESGHRYLEQRSWDVLGPKWLEAIRS